MNLGASAVTTSLWRLVFDTNVMVSALLLPGSAPREAVERALNHGTILVSPAVLAELSQVLSREKLRRLHHWP